MSDIQKKIRDTFQVDEEEIINRHLEDIEGWFNLSENRIDLSDEILDLPKKLQYLTYLLAAKIASVGNLRDEGSVSHEEADNYFGWSRGDGETSRHQASYLSDFLVEKKNGKREIAPAKVSKAVAKVKEKLD